MRAPVMVKEKDRLPPYCSVYEDLATPLGLVKVLEPNAVITRLVANASTIQKNKDNSFERPLMDGYATFEVTQSKGRRGHLVLNCLDQSQKHIEQTFRVKDLLNGLEESATFPEDCCGTHQKNNKSGWLSV